MRELKFYAWHKKLELLSTEPVKIGDSFATFINKDTQKPLIVQTGSNDLVYLQYIGCIDDNGKEIYEFFDVEIEAYKTDRTTLNEKWVSPVIYEYDCFLVRDFRDAEDCFGLPIANVIDNGPFGHWQPKRICRVLGLNVKLLKENIEKEAVL